MDGQTHSLDRYVGDYDKFMEVYEAKKAQTASHALFMGGGDDSNMPETEITDADLEDDQIGLLKLMVTCGLCKSNGEARKLVQGNSVSINGEKVTDFKTMITKEQLKEGIKIQKGKKVFHRAIMK